MYLQKNEIGKGTGEIIISNKQSFFRVISLKYTFLALFIFV